MSQMDKSKWRFEVVLSIELIDPCRLLISKKR